MRTMRIKMSIPGKNRKARPIVDRKHISERSNKMDKGLRQKITKTHLLHQNNIALYTTLLCRRLTRKMLNSNVSRRKFRGRLTRLKVDNGCILMSSRTKHIRADDMDVQEARRSLTFINRSRNHSLGGGTENGRITVP